MGSTDESIKGKKLASYRVRPAGTAFIIVSTRCSSISLIYQEFYPLIEFSQREAVTLPKSVHHVESVVSVSFEKGGQTCGVIMMIKCPLSGRSH